MCSYPPKSRSPWFFNCGTSYLHVVSKKHLHVETQHEIVCSCTLMCGPQTMSDWENWCSVLRARSSAMSHLSSRTGLCRLSVTDRHTWESPCKLRGRPLVSHQQSLYAEQGNQPEGDIKNKLHRHDISIQMRPDHAGLRSIGMCCERQLTNMWTGTMSVNLRMAVCQPSDKDRTAWTKVVKKVVEILTWFSDRYSVVIYTYATGRHRCGDAGV